MKKSLTLILTLLLALTCVSSAFAAGIAEGWDAVFWDEAAQTYKVGSKADFLGHKWVLWKVDETYACVITDKIQCETKFHSSAKEYSRSYARDAVNGLEKEMRDYTGFGKSEASTLTWDKINGGSANYIANSPTTDDGVGTDCLYLLSKSEAESMDSSVRTVPQKLWWLRSQLALSVADVYYVNYSGGIVADRTYYTRGIRPAMQINLKSDLFKAVRFQTALTGGKSDVLAGEGFTLADYDGSNGWKLTLKDKDIAKPEIILTPAGKSGEKLAVEYSGAATGENMYLSALLYDETGKLVNYAKVADTRDTGSGKTEIPLYNVPAGNYKIRFFCEKISIGSQPDYASELTGEYSVKSAGIFRTLDYLPTLAGNSSTTVLYDGKRWAKLSDTRLLMVDYLGSKTWNDAVLAGKNYAAGIKDAFESKIKESSALLTREEAEKLKKSELGFNNYWWLSTTNGKGTPDGISGLGDIVTMTNRSTAQTRPALNLKNTENIWFLSAIGGAKSAEAGKLVTTPETGREWKITYKDDNLPAPVLSGALTLDARGNSKWSSPTAERIAALIGSDGADAKGYLLMRDKNESGNGEILLNGAEGDIYIHSEIIGSSCDRMSAKSVQLAGLRYKNGYISGMTLEKEHSGAENPVTLKNGFELKLANKQLYAQDIASETGENVLYGTGEQGAKLLGNLAVESGSRLECEGRLEFTTLQLDGELIIKEGATVTLTSPPLGTNSDKPLQIEANGITANRGTKPVEVYDLAKQYKMTVPPGYYYAANEGEDYELKKIDWNDPEWEDANGGEGSSSSSGGCNAGFGALALLGVFGLFYRKKK